MWHIIAFFSNRAGVANPIIIIEKEKDDTTRR